MRRRAGLLAVTTGLVLAGTVLTAGAAEARNVGGSAPEGSTCVYPGSAQFQDPAAPMLPCICVSVAEVGTFRNVGGSEPDAACPPGLLRVRIDRNVGG